MKCVSCCKEFAVQPDGPALVCSEGCRLNLSFLAVWKSAKLEFEAATKSKKPSAKFLGIFHTSGLESVTRALDTSLIRFDIAAAKTTHEQYTNECKQYFTVLDKAAKDEGKSEEYKNGIANLKTSLNAIGAEFSRRKIAAVIKARAGLFEKVASEHTAFTEAKAQAGHSIALASGQIRRVRLNVSRLLAHAWFGYEAQVGSKNFAAELDISKKEKQLVTLRENMALAKKKYAAWIKATQEADQRYFGKLTQFLTPLEIDTLKKKEAGASGELSDYDKLVALQEHEQDYLNVEITRQNDLDEQFKNVTPDQANPSSDGDRKKKLILLLGEIVDSFDDELNTIIERWFIYADHSLKSGDSNREESIRTRKRLKLELPKVQSMICSLRAELNKCQDLVTFSQQKIYQNGTQFRDQIDPIVDKIQYFRNEKNRLHPLEERLIQLKNKVGQ